MTTMRNIISHRVLEGRSIGMTRGKESEYLRGWDRYIIQICKGDIHHHLHHRPHHHHHLVAASMLDLHGKVWSCCIPEQQCSVGYSFR